MGDRLFLYQENNEIAESGVVLTASHVKASDAILPPIATRADASNGLPVVSGSYTGDDDAEYAIKIVDEDVSDENLVSDPVKRGAGNSQLTNIAATGLAAQEFNVELVDLGDIATKARITIDGLVVEILTTGDAGNDWTVNVDRANTGGSIGGLTFTDSNFSVISDIPDGTSQLSGPAYDWETAIRAADGKVPATAKRVAFGDDTTAIYVQWKENRDGRWLYRFEPAIRGTIRAGTRVKFVTGGRLFSFINGSLQDDYNDIVTRYDLAAAINGNSTVYRVITPFINDRMPGGSALRDIEFRTDAYAESNSGSGSRFATGFKNVVVNSNANTELIKATCTAIDASTNNGAALGSELWKLEGSVLGALGNITTGIAYTHPAGRFALTIPQKLPPEFGTTPRGKISGTVTTSSETKSLVCLDQLTAGANAVDGTYIFTYTARPEGDCNCEDTPYQGSLDPECLGIDIEEDLTMLSDFRYRDALAELNRWRQGYIDEQTGNANIAAHSDTYDIQLCNLTYNALYDGLRRIFEDADADLGDSYVEYAADITVAANEAIKSGDFYYRAQNAGTVSSSPTTLTTTPGATTVENGITFKCIDKLPYPLWLEYFGDADTDLEAWDGLGLPASIDPWESAIEYSVDALKTPTTGNDHYYRLVWANPASSPAVWTVEPTWSTTGGIAIETANDSSGTRAWQDMGTYTGDSIQDIELLPIDGGSFDLDTWASKYEAQMAHVISAAQLDPKKASASSLASDCWRDPGDAFYWESQDGFLPWFNNQENYTAKKITVDGRNTIVDTMEFGVYLNIPCIDQLEEGDQIEIKITGASQPQTYQIGDELLLGMVAAQDQPFSGGADGDNIQTWIVTGSVVGKLANLEIDPDSPTPYSNGGLSFDFVKGGIADAVGSQFDFAVVGGHFQFRKLPAAFGANQIISATPFSLGDGISLTWDIGAFPSFETDDVFAFDVKQPNSANNIIGPDKASRWRWGSNASVNVLIDLLSAKTINAVALAHQTLPAVTLQAGTTTATSDFSLVLTPQNGVLAATFDPENYRYWRLLFTSATDLDLAHVFLGQSLGTQYEPAITLNYQFFSARSGDVNPVSRFKNLAKTYQIEWLTQSWDTGGRGYPLIGAEVDDIIGMIVYSKQNDDQPVIFIPNSDEAGAVIGRISLDQIPVPETYQHRQTKSNSVYGLAFELQEIA